MVIELKRLTPKDVFKLTTTVDKETADISNIQWPFNKQAALSFINDYNTWGIWLNGSIIAGAIEVKSDGETAYFVAINYRNQGIATEAVKQIREIYSDSQLHCVINPKNASSLKVAQKAGMRIKFVNI
jgi:RimJ/RimL family protein N-acetyltransferase|tara:strand:+ start:4160 stop:4543 length:384 start_codon:yes stop_codon:yes gene_type:complete